MIRKRLFAVVMTAAMTVTAFSGILNAEELTSGDTTATTEAIDLSGYKLPKTDRAVNIREAVFSKTEVISVDDAAGRIAGFVKTSCPPAVPIVVAGERISYEHIEILKAYGFDTIEVCCDFE